ncbi:toll-like receptor 12 [Candoia aspera]|uniref:toll-like receptor 12 n=1 Tax=Candoia aspera TaxID=51853 RepID=UPI002FD812C2
MERREIMSLTLVLFWMGRSICLALSNSKCLHVQGSLQAYVDTWFLCFAPEDSSMIIACVDVITLPDDIAAIPKEVQVLCISGTIKHLKAKTFQAFPKLRYLNLQLNQPVVTISTDLFLGLRKLQHLSLQYYFIGYEDSNITIPSDILLPMTSLEKLDLINVHLLCQRRILFPSQLKSLSISGFCLKQISGQLSNFPCMRFMPFVSLDHCRMESVFTSLEQHPNLSDFTVSASQLHNLYPRDQNRSLLQSLTLSSFPLSFNELLALEIDKLDSLSLHQINVMPKKNQTYHICALVSRFSLQSLKFSHNFYKTLNSQELPNCYSLKKLMLPRNQIEQVDSSLLYHLPHLQVLDLSSNQLHWNLCPLIYEKMNITSRLRVLDFSSNSLNSLQPYAFFCIPYLEILSLSNCGLGRIPVSAFSRLSQLKVLNLDTNNIIHLEHQLFSNLTSLTYLGLTDNFIQVLRTEFFQGLSVLQELHLGSRTRDLDVELSVSNFSTLYLASKFRIRFRGENINISFTKILKFNCQKLEVDSCRLFFFPQVKELHLLNFGSATFFCKTSKPFFHNFPLLENLYCFLNMGSSSWRGLNFSHLPNLRTLNVINLAYALKDLSVIDTQYLFQNLTQLEIMSLTNSGLKYLSPVLFQNMRKLHLLVLSNEAFLILDNGFQDGLKQLRYLYMTEVYFGCFCSNAWFISWALSKKDLYAPNMFSLMCQQLVTVKKFQQFLPFIEQNCSQNIDFILFIATSVLLLFLLSVPLVHAICGPMLLFLTYVLRGWWHRLCGEIRKGNRFEYDAFVSYCMQDQEWVLQHLVPNLELRGPPFLKLCLHSRDFVVGKAVVDNIMDSLYNSRKAICVISRHSLRNCWCSLEMNLATYRLLTEKEDTLILVFLEHISRYQLSAYHRLAKQVKRKTYLNWPEEPAAQTAFWNRLRTSLMQHLNGWANERI